MSDLINPAVYGTQGGVHAGTGDLHITYQVLQAGSVGRNARRQPTDDLRWLEQRFIHPEGFGKARDVLEAHRTVFLEAPPGSGRIAAAKVLLWELRSSDTEKFHELLCQEDHEPLLNAEHVGDGNGVWLDLSDVNARLWADINAELSSLRAAVREHSAHLVVVLPEGVTELAPEHRRYRVPIKRPPTREVLCRHLRVDGIPVPVPLPPLQFLDEKRPIRDIPAYVELIMEAREQAAGGDFVAWCAAAHRALAGQQRAVAKMVADLNEGRQRAFLLATAMLHGAHADVVHNASTSLLRAVEHPVDEKSVLEHAPLDQRLREINAELDDSGNVRFRELDYDSAVRAYFWTHMPDLHYRLGEWVGKLAGSAGLADGELANLVRRFTEQCLNERYRSIWAPLVERWTEEPSNGRMKAAALVLQHGLHDEKRGRIFRRQIYEWSCSNLSDRLAEVIVVACRDEMVNHPDEALVRLHHVARRERSTRARDALIGLVGGDRRFLRQMLRRVTDTNPERKKWPADLALFLNLADPEAFTDPGIHNCALITESVIRRHLSDGWSVVFAESSQQTWTPRAAQWLHCAAQNAQYRHTLLDVLVEGSQNRTAILARLYTMTRTQELRTIIGDLLLEKINASQGLQLA